MDIFFLNTWPVISTMTAGDKTALPKKSQCNNYRLDPTWAILLINYAKDILCLFVWIWGESRMRCPFSSECLNGCCSLGWDWKGFLNGKEEHLPNPLSKVGVPSGFLADYKWLSLDGSDSFAHTRVQSTFSSPFGATVWVSLLAWNANVKMYLLPTDRKQEKLF